MNKYQQAIDELERDGAMCKHRTLALLRDAADIQSQLNYFKDLAELNRKDAKQAEEYSFELEKRLDSDPYIKSDIYDEICDIIEPHVIR